ncbi:unnamed protein product [Soboliphyme baturini]|uniref:Calponin-homology (CH) domain-containing protein n=1 Tax=Soboliphyme baturini TaxID=241478 RepID=A0A183IV66_9BILA|nr:unnamed protein product [Soboliphyme baturini]
MNFDDYDIPSSMIRHHVSRSAIGGSSKRTARGMPAYADITEEEKRLASAGAAFPPRKRRRQDEREGQDFPKQVRMTDESLAVLTDMLKNVGVDLGRRLTVNDLDMLRWRLGGNVIDELLSRLNVFGTEGNETVLPHNMVQKERAHMLYDQHPVPLMGDSGRFGYRDLTSGDGFGMQFGEPMPLLPEMSGRRMSRERSPVYEQRPKGSDTRRYAAVRDDSYEYRDKSSVFSSKKSYGRSGMSNTKPVSPTMVPHPRQERPITDYEMRDEYESVRFASRPDLHLSDVRIDRAPGPDLDFGPSREYIQSFAREDRVYGRPVVTQKMRLNESRAYSSRSAMFPGSRYADNFETAQNSRW